MIVEGWLSIGENSEDEEVLLMTNYKPDKKVHVSWSDDEDILAERLECISNKFVALRYFISDGKISIEEANDNLIRQCVGDLEANYSMAYSEITGYLWTDEDLNVGGHDILKELYSYVGKYTIIDIKIDEDIEKKREAERELKSAKYNLNCLIKYAEKNKYTLEECIESLSKY